MKVLLLLSLFVYSSHSLQCYSCLTDFTSDCNASSPGQVVECPEGTLGCFIANGDIQGFEFEYWQRACAPEATQELGCGTSQYDTGEFVDYCVCEGDLCNETFETAGAEEI